jgi:putative colanic acid biosysnthesis UDP-glucose lipid carrier transferase
MVFPASTDEKDSSRTRIFLGAPSTVTSLVAAVLEPLLTTVCFLMVSRLIGEPIERSALVLCILVLALSFPGVNRFKNSGFGAAVDILGEWIALLAILFMCGYATDSLQFFKWSVLLWWAFLTPIFQWFAVLAGAVWLRRLSMHPSLRRAAVVVGAGPMGVKVLEALNARHAFGQDFVGFFEDRSSDRLHPDARNHVKGSFDDLAAWVIRERVRDVYITMPLTSQHRITNLLSSLQDTTASVYYVPDVYGFSLIQGRLQDMDGLPIVCLLASPFTGINNLTKRVSDIFLAFFILLLIFPLMIVLAIGVKLSSPGPVIFKQKRNGLDGEEIEVYKFRSMETHSFEGDVKQAIKDDPRVTAFGAFMRKTSLDELPQLINVLQGCMSIVGPRPHAVAHNEQYRKMIQAYMVRHKVRPGITGWAQVNGHRGETDTLEKMAVRITYDLEYLRNWSLWLDLKIILRTARLILFDRNAY